MNNEQKTFFIREHLDDTAGRRFLYTEEVRETHKKFYNKVMWEEMVEGYGMGKFGMESDCFILYALLHLGVASYDDISLFLSALSRKYPELSIAEPKKDVIEARMRIFYKHGLVFRFLYQHTSNGAGEAEVENIALYAITESGSNICRAKLMKQTAFNGQLLFKHLRELMGWASAGHVAVRIANQPGFVDYLERREKTPQLGSFYLPAEIKMKKDDEDYYIAFLSSYLGAQRDVQTPMDYAEHCAYKVSIIRNYLNCKVRKGMSGIPIVVVSVEGNKDLNEIVRCLCGDGSMKEFYQNIYFTGEGILNVNGVDLKDCFLQVVADSSERGYSVCQAQPTFI